MKGRPASAASWALRIFEAATICIARVIWAVARIDRMRLRMSRGLCMAQSLGIKSSLPALLELLGRRLQLGRQRVAERLLTPDPLQQLDLAGREEVGQLRLAFPN